MMRALLGASFLAMALGMLERVMAFDLTRNDNLAVYWGQDGAGNQQRLSYYCKDSTIDTIPLAFLYIFRGTGGEPVIDFANTCNQWDDPVYSGTALANCSFLAQDIKTCQAAGKIVTLSLGGGTGQVGFSSDSQAQSFADQIWNLFLGGKGSIRPFGDAILDGIDLDIESGTAAHYAAFVNRIRSNAGLTGLTASTFAEARANATAHANATSHHTTASKDGKPVVDVTTASKYYYITSAPQCPYPDAYIGGALNAAHFDAVYVQFYNNYCGLDQPSDYNFATWDNWAKTVSSNKAVKVYIGAPGSADAAGEGYVGVSTLANYVSDAQKKWSSFGGVMLWDADTAYTNGRFDKSIKTDMVTSGAKFAPKQTLRNATTHTTTKTQSDEDAAFSTPVEKPRAESRFFRL
ncbi:glycoside hydrolase family 18 protein [Polyporus arcularius HHB13444]|uniref:chitinase n=1 Tax=Polyporus arcularius HHB13444 TaxID=1314778 RepID=A0A5C3P2P3_9APHY|nr:glycoside hydrolase family 18 protein [Polyporus arcularius HHB13444]